MVLITNECSLVKCGWRQRLENEKLRLPRSDYISAIWILIRGFFEFHPTAVCAEY